MTRSGLVLLTRRIGEQTGHLLAVFQKSETSRHDSRPRTRCRLAVGGRRGRGRGGPPPNGPPTTKTLRPFFGWPAVWPRAPVCAFSPPLLCCAAVSAPPP